MGVVKPAESVKLVCGLIGADRGRMVEAQAALAGAFGRIDLESDFLPFDFTEYYRAEMGDGLLRRFVSFEEPVDPGRLATVKLATGKIEARFARSDGGTVRRRVNLDPGYVTPAKLVLATTKDFAHRVYLGRGIYAEVTLQFRKDGIVAMPWTYPDFRSGAYAPFLLEVRRLAMQAQRPGA